MDLHAAPASAPTTTRPATAGQVLQLVLSTQANSRSEIGRITGLSRTAVTARVNQLAAQGLIVENATIESTGGRRPG